MSSTTPKLSPAARYQQLLQDGTLLADDGQARAVAALDDLFQRLVARENAPMPGWTTRIGRRFGLVEDAPIVQGLYMWGGVGRGKTFLMALFFDALPFAEKQRMHFHRFMREVHRGLNERAGTANPLRKVADDFAKRGRILCCLLYTSPSPRDRG